MHDNQGESRAAAAPADVPSAYLLDLGEFSNRRPRSGVSRRARRRRLDFSSGRGARLGHRLARAGVRFVHGDIRAPEDLLALVPESPGLIIECSAEPSAQLLVKESLHT